MEKPNRKIENIMLKCILYDLDGVLVDACEWHRLSLNKALQSISNIELTTEEHETTFNGLPTKKKLDLLIKQNRIKPEDYSSIWQAKQNYTKEIISSTAKIDQDKIKLHQYVKEQGIKIACITNSITETASLMLEATGQLPFIDLLISNEQVKQPKPHGEGYIRGMIFFNSMPETTLIVEDSEVGLKAARSTGANIWQVKNSYDVVLNNFKELQCSMS